MPAAVVPGDNAGVRISLGEGKGTEFVPFDGLTKFEATAVRQMAAHRTRSGVGARELARRSVEDATALWDEIERLEKGDG